MSKPSIIALVIAVILGFGSAASALEGRDGDNHPIPGFSDHYSVTYGKQP